ncbi:uncharacterized protein LOC116172484 [Photinus pyralis]|uniref:uncharacterized protein LOC116172484 n=1 Tax=Photinus pyralis TaxID=7054 RepID=UPI001266EBB4|nr:uncharacterized protein LOC116172484 [Photinus pyralis]
MAHKINGVLCHVVQVHPRNWFKAARRDMPKSKSTFYCCEDHFNLEEDIENFVRYKLMGGKIILKQTVVPHRFDCQPDKKRASNVPVRTLPVKRARKQLVDEAIAESEKRQQNLPLLVDEAITESDKIQQNLPFTNVEEPVPVLL